MASGHNERTLRSSLPASLDSVSGSGKAANIDKSLVTSLNTDKDLNNDDYMFHFDRRLMTDRNKFSLKLFNERQVKIVSDSENRVSLSDYILKVVNGDSEVKSETQNDEGKANSLLEEKKNLKIIDVSENGPATVVSKKGAKYVKTHKINLRNRSKVDQKKPYKLRKRTLCMEQDDSHDPLYDDVYSRYHKSKLRTERSFAIVDKTKYLDDVRGLYEKFCKLLGLLDTDSKLIMNSYTNVLLKSMETGELPTDLYNVEYFSNSSFFLSYIVFYILKLHDGSTPKYNKLYLLLDNFKDGNLMSFETEKNQYNNLRYLLQKSEDYRLEFKDLLLKDKGYKELFEEGQMRVNLSLNFTKRDFENGSREKAPQLFNSFENFKSYLIDGRKISKHKVYLSKKLEESLLFSSDRILQSIDPKEHLYNLQLTAKDISILRLVKELTYINPGVLKWLEELGSQRSEGTFDQNKENFAQFGKVVHYISNVILLTLYEMFKLLKFFRGYWDNRNEFLLFMRSKEHHRILGIKHPELKRSTSKKRSGKTLYSKYENYDCLRLCLSDVSENEEQDEYDCYSDPEESIPLDVLRLKRKRQMRKKYALYYRLNLDYFSDDDCERTIDHSRRRVVLKMPNGRVVFDPRFGTKFFE